MPCSLLSYCSPARQEQSANRDQDPTLTCARRYATTFHPHDTISSLRRTNDHPNYSNPDGYRKRTDGVGDSMIRKVAEYTVREGELDAVLDAVARFVAAVRSAEPGTEYSAYRRGDSLSLLHFMSFPDAEAEKAHQKAPYTSELVAVLYPRCVEPPRFTELRAVTGEHR